MLLTPSQNLIAADTHRFRVVCSGRRFGKTVLATEEIKGKAISQPSRIVYIGPTLQQTRDIVWDMLVKQLLPATRYKNESRLELKINTLTGGESLIALRGWEAVETLRGQQFDFIIMDEVASMREFWLHWFEVVRPTLTDTKGEALFISTPKGFNHFYDLYNQEARDLDFKSFHFTSYDNPHIPKEEIDKAKTEIPEDRFAQEYMADFRKTTGLVYKEFDRAKHLFNELEEVPNKVERFIGIDWGYTNPTAAVIIDRDRDSNFWVVGEYYHTGKTTQEVIEYLKTMGANCYYPDPAEPDRLEECRRAGMNVREVSKDVTKGIDAVRTLMKNGKLKIWRGCPNLIGELETYTYKGKTPDRNAPEEPIKENDHALDALRYALYMQGTRYVLGVEAQQRYPSNPLAYRRVTPKPPQQ